jgi:hypothetical protein
MFFVSAQPRHWRFRFYSRAYAEQFVNPGRLHNHVVVRVTTVVDTGLEEVVQLKRRVPDKRECTGSSNSHSTSRRC